MDKFVIKTVKKIKSSSSTNESGSLAAGSSEGARNLEQVAVQKGGEEEAHQEGDEEELVEEGGEGEVVESTSTATASKKSQPRLRINKFSSRWLSIPQFSDWLQKSAIKKDGHDLAYCKVCVAIITAHKNDLFRHCNSEKHKQRMKEVASNIDIRKISATPYQESIKRAEVKLAALLAKNNLPFSLMDEFCESFPTIFTDSHIAKGVHQHRTKATAVVKNCLAKEFEKELCEKLRKPDAFYSMIIDETTDCGSIKECGIIIIYFNDNSNQVETKFLDLVEMPSSTAKDLLQCVKECLSNKGISLQNLVGFSADTCNVMFGNYVSVTAMLKEELPDIACIKFSCHSLHLAASKACLKLPRSLEDLVRNLGSHFSRSFGRQEKFKEFQQFFGVEIHKILTQANTRWLSLKACVDRVLEQFVPIREYLRVAVFDDPSRTTEDMLHTMNNKFIEVYLEFLSYALSLFTSLNKLFQGESPLLYRVKPEVEALIKSLCGCYMRIPEVRSVKAFELDHTDSSKFVQLENIYLGIAAQESLDNLKKDPNVNPDEFKGFLQTCQAFCIEAVSQLKKRFDFDDPLYKLISVVDPTVAQSPHFEIRTLLPIVERFSILKNHIDPQSLEREWRDFSSNQLDYNIDSSLDASQYWKKVFSLKNNAGSCLYPNVKEVIKLLLILPFSNAPVERLFSHVKNVKTLNRNKLKTSTVSALIKTKEAIQEIGGVSKFEPTKSMLKSKVWKP